jgi:glycosyltransferase involved in cell wall biosynthesis
VNDFIDVAKRLPQYDFVWFGKRWNKILNANPDMAKALDEMPSNVKLPGFVEDTASAFAAMDALFFPSFTENQPMTILESATLGLPLVVRDIPEYQGFLTHGVNSLKAQNVDEFAHHLQRVAEDHQLRERLSQEARALTDVHNLSHVGQRLKSLYTSLIQQHSLVTV